MTVGHGIGIDVGDADAVAVLQSSDAPLTDRPVLVQPATLRISATAATLGAPRDEPGVVTGFLAAVGDPEGITAADGTEYLGEDLVATAVSGLLATAARQFPGFPDDPALVAVHPARWDEARVGALRAAFDRSGLSSVGLIPDAVAATAWFEATQDLQGDGTVAVCDFDTAGVTVSVVGVGGEERRLVSSTFTPIGGSNGADETLTAPLSTADAAESADVVAGHDAVRERWRVALDDLCTTDAGLRGVVLTGAGAATPQLTELAAQSLSALVVAAPNPARAAARGAAILAAAASAARGGIPVDAMSATVTERLPVVVPKKRPEAFAEAVAGAAVRPAAASAPRATAPSTPPPSRRALAAAGSVLSLLVVTIVVAATMTRGGSTATPVQGDTSTVSTAPTTTGPTPSPTTSAARPTTAPPAAAQSPRSTRIVPAPVTTTVAPPPVAPPPPVVTTVAPPPPPATTTTTPPQQTTTAAPTTTTVPPTETETSAEPEPKPGGEGGGAGPGEGT